MRYHSSMRIKAVSVLYFSLLCCFFQVSSYAQEAALNMPSMPQLPAMPNMPNTDEPMAGRKAFEERSGLRRRGVPASPDVKSVKGGEVKRSNNESISPSSSLTPSSSSPLSAFSKLLSDYTDIDELLQQLSSRRSEEAPRAAVAVPEAHENIASILRFVVNGSDVRSSCRNIHFSKQEADGSFLLTAERRYWAGNAQKALSFYLLFKTAGGGGSHYYDVTCTVAQDDDNTTSFLSRLSSVQGLTASKTGNLVTMRVEEEDLSVDLLLDIGQ